MVEDKVLWKFNLLEILILPLMSIVIVIVWLNILVVSLYGQLRQFYEVKYG